MCNEEMSRSQENLDKATGLLEVCGLARRELDAAMCRMESARGWGIWDMLGGKFVTTLMKHHRIDQGREHLDVASRALRRRKTELKQLSLSANLAPDIGGFAVFSDFVFDDIFSALYVQGKIQELRQQIESTLRQLDRVETALRKAHAYEKGKTSPVQ